MSGDNRNVRLVLELKFIMILQACKDWTPSTTIIGRLHLHERTGRRWLAAAEEANIVEVRAREALIEGSGNINYYRWRRGL